MIDLHTHILSGIDDGVKSKKEALKVAEAAVDQGIKKLIATPHYLPGENKLSFLEVKKKVIELQEFFRKKGVNITLLPGMEVYINPNLVKQVESGIIKGLNNSRYILVELPMTKIPSYTGSIFYNLIKLGYTPIIAHPERCQKVKKNPNLLYRWVNEGALAQLNAGSLLGMFGSQVKRTAEVLVKSNLVQLIASDLHSAKSRGECLNEAVILLKELIGDQTEKYIKNAKLVVNDQEVDILSPERINKVKVF